MIDDLITRYGEDNVAYIYCDYRDQTNQTIVNLLGSLLRQLLTASYVPGAIITILESIKNKSQRLERGDISQILKAVLQQLNRSFLCFDALDELEPRTRFELLGVLGTEFGTAHIFLTGRPHIQSEVNRALQAQLDPMHITADQGDIRAYLIHEIEEDKKINPDDMNDQLKEEILAEITGKASGMYVIYSYYHTAIIRNYFHKCICSSLHHTHIQFLGFSFLLCISVWSLRSRQKQQGGRP